MTDALVRFLAHDAPVPMPYVLGDLFEFWIGDDDPNPFTARWPTPLRP